MSEICIYTHKIKWVKERVAEQYYGMLHFEYEKWKIGICVCVGLCVLDSIAQISVVGDRLKSIQIVTKEK